MKIQNQFILLVSLLSNSSRARDCELPLHILNPGEERFVLGVMTRDALGITPYFGSHISVVKQLPRSPLLWAGELHLQRENDATEIVQANETSGYAHTNKLSSDAKALIANPHIPLSKDAKLYRFDENRHLLPMPERGGGSENLRHDLNQKLTLILNIPQIFASDYAPGSLIQAPLRDTVFADTPIDAFGFELVRQILPNFYDDRANNGLRIPTELPNLERSLETLNTMEDFLAGRQSLYYMDFQNLLADLEKIVELLTSRPDQVTVLITPRSQ